jgi:hypothetical protein
MGKNVGGDPTLMGSTVILSKILNTCHDLAGWLIFGEAQLMLSVLELLLAVSITIQGFITTVFQHLPTFPVHTMIYADLLCPEHL